MTNLQANIIARNRINAQINELAPLIREVLLPFIGQKIITINNDLTGRAKSALEPYLGSNKIFPKLQIYRHSNSYSLQLVFKTWENTSEHSVIYRETPISFGSINDQVLTKVFELDKPLRTDYFEAEIKAIFEKLDKLRREQNDLENKLDGFGQCY